MLQLKHTGIFVAASLILGFAHRAAFAAPAPIPAEFVEISNSIQKEKSREKRLQLLTTLQTLVKKRAQAIPASISESEIPQSELLFELDLYLNNLQPAALNPANCPRAQKAIGYWANPTGETDDGNPTGRFVLDVVRSVCRE
jgi:hypothetical protein